MNKTCISLCEIYLVAYLNLFSLLIESVSSLNYSTFFHFHFLSVFYLLELSFDCFEEFRICEELSFILEKIDFGLDFGLIGITIIQNNIVENSCISNWGSKTNLFRMMLNFKTF